MCLGKGKKQVGKICYMKLVSNNVSYHWIIRPFLTLVHNINIKFLIYYLHYLLKANNHSWIQIGYQELVGM
jgi:hypothetical protein